MQGPLPPMPQGWVASIPPVRQSFVRPTEFCEVQASPVLGPRSQVPVAGLLGLPLTGEPPERQRGQGWPAFPVM